MSEASNLSKFEIPELAKERQADLKVILLGDSAVGKSKLVERFLMNDYQPRQLSTYALNVFDYETEVDGKKILVAFWDTGGQERFASMHPTYYFRAHSCILVFDVTRKITYQHLNDWYKEVRQYSEQLPILVVANKIDIDYKVTEKKFGFPIKKKLDFIFCSAADGTNVVQTFEQAIAMAYKFKKEAPQGDYVESVLETLDYFDKKDEVEDDSDTAKNFGKEK